MKKLILATLLFVSLGLNSAFIYDYFNPSPEELDLKDQFVKGSLEAMGVESQDHGSYTKENNNFIAFDGGVICVIFYPLTGMGRQDVSCFNFDTGGYLGGLGYGIKTKADQN